MQRETEPAQSAALPHENQEIKENRLKHCKKKDLVRVSPPGRGEEMGKRSSSLYAILLSFVLLTFYNIWAPSAVHELPKQLANVIPISDGLSDAHWIKEQWDSVWLQLTSFPGMHVKQ